ncbi:MAG: aromatic ring-hydroxylating dioxygenase subunit alpha [Sphingomonadaceae bacterium]|uniref:aromatic ring-hydroxylating oxygenase subunit alpha n=1 Tax=Thermaurantiacus sp. TaxID=2820283 RepID=UPI00298F081F|nr:aromatic ring-hydroxylating dioxygenase subunit alpha [Thermaurantiacus sp.]MCS6986019.1 aromatic ring-hydroxylating dioxygenase subunit alpha [Sphingomonadaceae bacterium]MDW8414765.1 aromatic ring-hydroxylating dioxygenase subunit alpha [Thermaurantiacus sp.]
MIAADVRAELRAMLRSLVDHGVKGTLDLAPSVVEVPTPAYTDPERFAREKKQIFRRLPLMLAPSCELPHPGCYKAMEVVGVPVLLVRQPDGTAAAFLNMCTHRGNPLARGRGRARRFTCGYHGWTFGTDGRLLAVAAAADFGTVDRAALCLKRLPCLERAGFVFAILDPQSSLSIDEALCGYDRLLEAFGFQDWVLFDQRELPGPNWKTAYDGYLDFYHLPVLHANTFGADFFNRANYFAWGPHQRLANPSRFTQKVGSDERIDLAALDEADWPDDALLQGVWTIFPHVSIATFYGGGVRGALVSQLFPGREVGESVTTQYYLVEREPATEAERKGAHDQFEFLKLVVADEDYATGRRQHEALMSGGLTHVLFGRNEGGGQRFHAWVERILNASDAELGPLFRAARAEVEERRARLLAEAA